MTVQTETGASKRRARGRYFSGWCVSTVHGRCTGIYGSPGRETLCSCPCHLPEPEHPDPVAAAPVPATCPTCGQPLPEKGTA